MNRSPSLDGVRGIAIVFVLAGHCLFRFRPGAGNILGCFGVSIFFVLSGYLITGTMVADEARFGALRIRRFYGRRALRILPPFYFFMAGAAVACALGILPAIDKQTWASSLLYFRNITGTGWDTGHLWSLALEEQFYLAWPILFMITKRFRLPFICGAVALFTAHRFQWLATHPMGESYLKLPDLRLDTFLIGGAAAIVSRRSNMEPQWLFLAALLVSPFCFSMGAFGTLIPALIIAAWISSARSSVALAMPALVMLGDCSYSIYLWQQVFLGPHLQWWSLPALSIVVAVSYLLIERPILMSLRGDRNDLCTLLCTRLTRSLVGSDSLCRFYGFLLFTAGVESKRSEISRLISILKRSNPSLSTSSAEILHDD